jgi:hypothetical protein
VISREITASSHWRAINAAQRAFASVRVMPTRIRERPAAAVAARTLPPPRCPSISTNGSSSQNDFFFG